jgi:uncharacterized protein (TIGR03067 family)
MGKNSCRQSALVSFSLLAASGGPGLADNDVVAKELKARAGSWKLASVEVEGKPVPKGDLPAILFTLHPDGKSTVRTPDGAFQTKSVIDLSKTPKTLDIEYLGGPLKGQKQYGIYKVEDDRWTVFSTPPGGKPEDRPREFDSKAAKGALVVWERVKDDKKR